MFWVTSNDGFDDILTKYDSLEHYNQMELSSVASVEDDLIEWGKWDWGTTAIINNLSNISFENSKFNKNNTGLFSSTQDSTFCRTSIFTDNTRIGIYYLNNIQGKIEQTIFLKNNVACEIKHRFCGKIENNYFSNNETGCFVWSFHGYISHNDFRNNAVMDIKFVGNIDTIINQFNIINNVFSNGFGLHHFFPGSSYGYISQLNINYNNFENSYFFISYYFNFINIPINMQFNYFNGFSNIEQIIENVEDILGEDPTNELIVIEPFETIPFSDAGIVH